MDAIKFRRTLSLVASAALVTSLTVGALAAPAAARPDEQQEAAQEARAEARAEAKAARAEAKEARAAARAEAKAARAEAKAAARAERAEAKATKAAARAEAKAARAEAKAARAEAKAAGADKMTVCHKPGTPAEGTLEIAASAMPGHLAHGDVEGACVDLAPVALTTCEDDGAPCDEPPQLVVAIDAPESVDSGDVLQLQGAVSGIEAVGLSYTWSSSCLTDEQLSDPEVIASEPATAILTIREDVLVPETTCEFTLTVADEATGADGSETVSVQVTTLP